MGKIRIKSSHRGRFTKWCKKHGYKGVTNECVAKAIAMAKRLRNKALKKQAIFAQNARKWRK